MTTRRPITSTLHARRVVARRAAAVAAALTTVTLAALVSGSGVVWPLFVFPLVLAAVFFFEVGSIVVTLWLGAFFVASHGLISTASASGLREATLGTALFLAAGLLLGRLQRRTQEQAARLAASSLTDRLTGLYNYGTFIDHLRNEVTKVDRYGGEVSLIMLDLDHFKQFNDLYGHEAGNDLLSSVGATLRAHVRDADIAARYGGEEFAVLIRGGEIHGYELAQRLRRAVERITLEVRSGDFVGTTISAGVATYPAGSGNEGELIERSDDALYESKRRGRNRVTIHAGAAAEQPAATALSA
jgi:diguanylate cyclase (GGDEF)-like protein